MSFAWLGALWVVVGAGGLAAVLFALQRLRVRHREVTVPTTMFWREAVEEARARVLMRRFRHPWAYVLVLAIAWLMWVALAGPRLGAGRDTDYVLVLDGSAAMARGDRFAMASEQLAERVAATPRANTMVLFCGGGGERALLEPGENALLLEHRLAALAPAACPSRASVLVRGLVAAHDGSRPLVVEVFGAAPVDARESMLPDSVELVHWPLQSATTQANRGITAIGATPAASLDYERVDVLIEIRGGGETAPQLALEIDGEPWTGTLERADVEPAAARFIARDLPADGRLLRVRLAGVDGLGFDNDAALILPARSRIRIALAPGTPDALREVLAADPGIAVVSADADPDTVARPTGSDFGGARPALEWTDSAAGAAAFAILDDAPGDAGEHLQRTVEDLGLDAIDSTALAESADRPIVVTLDSAEQRAVRVWRALLGEQFNLIQSRAFPLFAARAVRWLAGEERFTAYAAAGEAVTGVHDALVDPAGLRQDPVGAAFTPPVAGTYRSAAGVRLAVALTDPDATVEPSAAGQPPEAVSTAGSDLVTLLVLIGLLLLAAEWFLFRTGRMP